MSIVPAEALILAPMAEIGHTAFRHLVALFGGCDLYFTEMVSAPGIFSGAPYEELYLRTTPEPHKTVIQLFGGRAEELIRAADYLNKKSDCAGIDINMGCSAPEIYKRHAGVRWMEKPDEAAALVSDLRSAVTNKSLSVKMRIMPEEQDQIFLSFAGAIANAGADFITIHGRTRQERFGRPSRWNIIAAAAQKLPIPVVANGDINSFASWREKKEHCKPHAIMIGRAAIKAPWIFAHIKQKALYEQHKTVIELDKMLLQYCAFIEQELPPDLRLVRLRAMSFYFIQNLRFGQMLVGPLRKAEDFETLRESLLAYFERCPDERIYTESL